MKITFLIGNGFDVGLGMNSSFADFFPQYIDKSERKAKLFQAFASEIDRNRKEWSYFELQIGQYTKCFSKETKQLLLDQFSDFEMDFVEYLKTEEAALSFQPKEKIAQTLRQALQSFYSTANLPVASNKQISELFSKYASQEHVYNFISFNYTSTLEKCLELLDDGIIYTHKYAGVTKTNKVGKIVHVHGTLDQYPIMGPNDESQIANKELAQDSRFLRYILKPEINKAHRMNYDIDASDLLNSSNIICIYGMSLGATDKLWWNKILTWLASGSDRQLVIFAFDNHFSTSNHFQRLTKEDELIDTLSQYPTNKEFQIDPLRNRIHVAIHKNIFEMKWMRQEKKLYSQQDSLPQTINIAKGFSKKLQMLNDDEIKKLQKSVQPLQM